VKKVDFADYNRKDDFPSNTVKRIKEILDKKNISTVITNLLSYEKAWYSVRVELLGIDNIGVNGKGITKEYALASAYAELMERLQAGYLIKPYNKQVKQLLYKHTYIDFFSGEKFRLENNLLETSCGSNGLAAGNTKKEAIVQALCETLERKAIKEIFFCENFNCGHFPISYFENNKCYILLKYILDKGYNLLVFDCTSGGKMPVLGVMICDANQNKYICKIASDINIDICIQRCITEIFQGKRFDIIFNNCLKNKYDNNILIYNNDFYKSYEYIRFVIDGSGFFPPNVLENIFNKESSISNLNVFCNKKLNNAQALSKISVIVKKFSNRLFIKDYSILGFPTYRIYIPNFSEAFLLPGDTPQKYIEIIKGIQKCVFTNSQSVSNYTVSNLLKFLYQVNNFPTLIYNFDLARICGIEITFSAFRDIDLLIALCHLYLNNRYEAFAYVNKYYLHIQHHHAHIFFNLLQSMKNNNFNQYLEYIKFNCKDEKILFFINYIEMICNKKMGIFNCDIKNCKTCFFEKRCNHIKAQKTINQLFESTENY